MTEHVLVEKSEQLKVLTLNRPEKKNALTRDMYVALATEINDANEDPSVRCVLLQARGDMFTATTTSCPSRSINLTASSQARFSTHSPIETISPVSSASGMNCPG